METLFYFRKATPFSAGGAGALGRLYGYLIGLWKNCARTARLEANGFILFTAGRPKRKVRVLSPIGRGQSVDNRKGKTSLSNWSPARRRTRALAASVIAGLAFVLAVPILAAQEDPLVWFPLEVGNRWIYDHESKSGDAQRPEVTRWTTDEAVTEAVTIPEGLIVLRQVKQQGESPGDYLTERDNAPYLVHKSCIYSLAGGWGPKGQDDAWDNAAKTLILEYRQALESGEASPDLCFPLRTANQWGNNDIPWRVKGRGDGGSSFLPEVFKDAFHIFSSHFGSGGLMDVWLEKGVGIVGEHYLHDGTYDEYTRKLRQFIPAKSAEAVNKHRPMRSAVSQQW
jgi:hypothetical protein